VLLKIRTITNLTALLATLVLFASMASAAVHRTSKTAKTTSVHSKKTSKTSKSRHSRQRVKKVRGQRAIDEQRARQIQSALIREHYLDGEPTGEWDARSKAAMQKFQADNGWQTKVVPDARALIKLGLGPNHDNLLNPETAATNPPPPDASSAAGGPSFRQ